MDSVIRAYNYVFYEQADPRVKDWPLMKSPAAVLLIATTYLVLIKVMLPAHMRYRKPYCLKNIIKWYNIVQICANAVVTWGIITSGWTTHYHLGCLLPDYSMDPQELRMLRFLWWTVILKLMELSETVFFVLRKKERQASFLHIYHHVSTLIIMWCGVKFIGGGMTSFPPMLNNMIHVVMYSYYLLSAEGNPKIRAFLNKFKKWITIMQMVQFTVLLIHAMQVFLPSCPAPKTMAYLYLPNVMLVYYLFYDFYKQNYSKRNTTKKTGKQILNENYKSKLYD